MTSEEVLRKKLKRIQLAQEEAEKLLEEKSRELYQLNSNLEQQVKERTEEFEKARDEAIAANKAKSQFLANMSHEIRTPLNGMLGFIGLLQNSNLDSNQLEQLETVEKSGNLLLTIINDILEFSKIEAGKLDIDNSKFHLKRCMEDIIDVMANEVFSKKLELPNFLDERIPKNLVGDESRIRQVLLNLIGNAVKFTPSGEICVNARLEGINNEGQFLVTFEVSDTGVGISKEALEKIFSPFEQADISDTRKYGGTGLGLTISRQIVAAMGGELKVESEESKGSRFFFTLPLSLPEGESAELSNRDFAKSKEYIVWSKCKTLEANLLSRLASWRVLGSSAQKATEVFYHTGPGIDKGIIVDASIASRPEELDRIKVWKRKGIQVVIIASPKEKTSLCKDPSFAEFKILPKPVKREDLFNCISGPKRVISKEKLASQPAPNKLKETRVLLVEDNMINQQVALAMLGAHGISADVANNGQEATEKYDPSQHSLILMDCQMPVMDGFDATKLLREQGHEVPIIAMTANAFKKTKEECFDVGMNDFITKPVKDQELAEIIKRNLP